MDDHVKLEANPDYWFGTPLVDELVFRVIPDAGTRIAELLSGGVHVALEVPMDQINKINTDTTRASVNSGRRIMYLAIKSNDPSLPTHDKRVRQAMNYAVDVQAITDSLMQGYTKPYDGVLTSPNNDPTVQAYAYDPDRAKQLLAEAGYADGFDLVIDSPNGRYVKDTEVAQIVAKYLNDVGIRATVQTHEWATYSTRLREGNINGMYLLGNGGFPSSFEELSTIFDPRKNPSAAHGYANPQFQSLMDQANVTVDQAEHVSLLHEAQRILWDDAPAIFGYTQPVAWGISKQLEGYEASPNEYLRLYWALTNPR
jgi:peptide/nickel transport system substrate-binding protein